VTKKETAEQKLLKIIESQGAAETSSNQSSPGQDLAQQVASSVKGVGLPPVSLPSVLAPLMGLLKGLTPGKSTGTPFGIREINKLFMLAIGVVCFLFVANVLGGMKMMNQKITFHLTSQAKNFSDDFIPSLVDISDYLENIKRRNIFRPFEKKAEAPEMVVENISNPRITELTQDWKLVGISWLSTPESASVMIENTKTGITYFLRQGEEFHGVTIKNIYADRVLLGCEGEELTLKL